MWKYKRLNDQITLYKCMLQLWNKETEQNVKRTSGFSCLTKN